MHIFLSRVMTLYFRVYVVNVINVNLLFYQILNCVWIKHNF